MEIALIAGSQIKLARPARLGLALGPTVALHKPITSMKPLLATLFLVSTFAVAQTPEPPRPVILRPVSQIPNETGDPLPQNYFLRLIVNDKDQQIEELSLVFSSTEMNAKNSDLTFRGTFAPEENGTMLVRFRLIAGARIAGTNGSTERIEATGEAQTSVRVRIGEPIEIMRNGTKTYRLIIARDLPSSKKDK